MDQITEKDRQVAELVAQAVMARILSAIQNEETASRAIGVWGGAFDRIIGRALRRLGFYVLIGLLGIFSLKMGLLDKLGTFFK